MLSFGCSHQPLLAQEKHQYSSLPDTAYIHELLRKAQVFKEYQKDSAIYLYQKILQLSEAVNYKDGMFESALQLGDLAYDKGDEARGKDMYFKASAYFNGTKNPALNASRLLNNIGLVYLSTSNYTNAILYFTQSASIALNDKTAIANLFNTYNNLAGALSRISEFKKALYYLDLAGHIAYTHKDTSRLISINVNKGVVYESAGNDSLAMIHFNSALDLARKVELKKSIRTVLVNIAGLLTGTHRPREALRCLDEASTITNDLWEDINLLYGYSCAYYELTDDNKAEKYLLKMMEVAKKKGATEYVAYAYELLSLIYGNQHKYKQAFIYLRAFYRLNDSLQNKEKAITSNKLELTFRTAQKDKMLNEKQLFIQKQKQELQRKNIWIGGIISGTLILCLSGFGLYKNYRHRQHLQDKQLKIFGQEHEINQLKAVMEGEERERTRMAQELHDGIGSNLAALKMDFTAIQNDHSVLKADAHYTDALNRLDIIYQELRQVAHHLTPEVLLQHGLSDSIALYCEQIAKANKLDITFQNYGIPRQINPTLALAIYRIVQELVHNIIKHAHASEAFVLLSYHDHIMGITIEDNGVGFDPETSSTGIGLKNLETRIRNASGRISIDSSVGNGTSIYLEFDTK